MLRLWYAMRARTLRVIALALLTGVIGCGTIYLSDAAVDLAKCVNESAARMSASRLDSARADCAVHDGRTVTAVLLSDTTLPPLPGDRVVALLRELGLPEDAIFYHGPDSPSIGLPVNVMGRSTSTMGPTATTGNTARRIRCRGTSASPDHYRRREIAFRWSSGARQEEPSR